MRILLLLCVALLSTQSIADEMRDPMKPPAFALNKFRLEKLKNTAVVNKPANSEKQKKPWVLNSILISSGRQHAIINNTLVRKGEKIAGARLVSLQPDHVRLVRNGKVIVLKLPGVDYSIKKSLNEKKL